MNWITVLNLFRTKYESPNFDSTFTNKTIAKAFGRLSNRSFYKELIEDMLKAKENNKNNKKRDSSVVIESNNAKRINIVNQPIIYNDYLNNIDVYPDLFYNTHSMERVPIQCGIDAFLKRNNLIGIQVPSDGLCFISCIRLYIAEVYGVLISNNEMRMILEDLFIRNREFVFPFLQSVDVYFDENNVPHERVLHTHETYAHLITLELDNYFRNYRWLNDFNDLLIATFANLLKFKIIIIEHTHHVTTNRNQCTLIVNERSDNIGNDELLCFEREVVLQNGDILTAHYKLILPIRIPRSYRVLSKNFNNELSLLSVPVPRHPTNVGETLAADLENMALKDRLTTSIVVVVVFLFL